MGQIYTDDEMAQMEAAEATQPPQAKKFYTDDEMAQMEAGDPSESPVTAAALGTSLGSTPFAASIAGAGKAGLDALLGGSFENIPKRFSENFNQDYEKNRQSVLQANAVAAKANPKTHFGFSVASSTVNPLFKNAGTAADFAKAGAIQNLGETRASHIDPDLKNMVHMGADTALGAAAGYGGYKIGEGIGAAAASKTGREAIRRTQDALESAGQKVYDKSGRVADWILKKSGKLFHSMPEEYSQKYLNKEVNKSARPAEEIMEEIQLLHDQNRDKVGAAEKALQGGKETVRTNAEAMLAQKQALENQLADQKFNTSSVAQDAKRKFSEASQLHKETLQSQNVRHLIPQIQDSIRALKDKVNADSAHSYDLLGGGQGNVSVRPFLEVLEREIEGLQLKGDAVTGTDAAAIKELQSLHQRISNAGPNISMPDAKFILQRLGPDTKWNPNAGSYADVANKAKQNAYTRLNGILRFKVPEYGRKMDELKADTELLKELSERFGNPAAALSRLENISTTKGQYTDLELLKRLGQITKTDFEAPLQRYVGIQNTLKTPSRMREVQSKFPEYAEMTAAEAEQKRLSDPKTRRAIMERVKASQEGKALQESKNALKGHEEALGNAEKEFGPYRPFSQGSVQAKVKGLSGARNYSPKKLFAELDKATGKEYTKEISDRAILDAFERTDTNGSRKTVMGKALGKAIGMILGGLTGKAAGGPAGAIVGTSIGFSADKYSGQVLKKMMDGKISSADAIASLKPKFGKYSAGIVEAMKKGPKALAVTLSLLSSDPEFKRIVESEE